MEGRHRHHCHHHKVQALNEPEDAPLLLLLLLPLLEHHLGLVPAACLATSWHLPGSRLLPLATRAGMDSEAHKECLCVCVCWCRVSGVKMLGHMQAIAHMDRCSSRPSSSRRSSC